ncbi:MAG: hypothetical protein GF418_08145 [Chitinivibrionales bacterium]|nr:hypothetical protein [Chitinivibrionales bacterium]MBD3395584.1 hypothetical protein [Chitinivibrionales bacterium]
MSLTKPLRVNSHIHSPYSFSAFDSVEQAVTLAREQGVAALGLSDFNLVDGHEEFAGLCARYGVYPLFNMETITLVREDKDRGFRYNDGNPGIIYFCCEALDHPASFSQASRDRLHTLWAGTQSRMREMIANVNRHFAASGLDVSFDYESMRERFAKNTVRERHLAKAIFHAVVERWPDRAEALDALEKAMGTRAVDLGDPMGAQGTIRGALLKAGKPCYVEEDLDAFMTPAEARELVLDGGGVPCYPIWIDDRAGYSEYEKDPDALADTLLRMGFHCVEFIPLRNDYDHFKSYVLRMHERGFNVIFGTEHNTPKLIPLYPMAYGDVEFDEEIMRIGYRGICVLAAHQERRRQGQDGYVDRQGERQIAPGDMDAFAHIGDEAIRRAIDV